MPQPTAPDKEARAAQLRAANINPRTVLATDYLNHFNEAIMLLEMIPDMPECADDFLSWHPLSYAEHFTASHFKARDLAIEAYESADANVRAEFDNITAAMTSILTAVSAAIQAAGRAGRRHHQWPRRRDRRRLHHDALDHDPIRLNRITISSLFEHDLFGKPVSIFPDHI